jgi:Icc-related predicted phosphoesterase
MRLLVLSDLHIEFAPLAPPAAKADAVILAGDVHVGLEGLQWIQKSLPEVPVVYVLGNHEYYKHTFPTVAVQIQEEAAGTNVHVLENGRFDLGDVTFLGATLWTDFALHGKGPLAEICAQEGMSDYHVIKSFPHDGRLRPSETKQKHLATVRWLLEQCPKAAGRKLVVVTHHLPSRRSIPEEFSGDPLNPAYASNLEELVMESRARLWVHGHVHQCVDYTLGETRVVANPRGYPGEQPPGFQGDLIIEV